MGKKSFSVLILLILFSFFLFQCSNSDKRKPDNKAQTFSSFAGSESCYSCHKSEYESHIKTAHYLTSAIVDTTNVAGSYRKGKNEFVYDPFTLVRVEKRGDSLYQVAFKKGKEVVSRHMDIVIGSGKRGQTFLYWKGHELFELPLSFFTETGQWLNSPGFNHEVAFNRPITTRCLECHSTFFDSTATSEQGLVRFSGTNIIYGVSCERCHGGGKDHVDYHTKNPADREARFIINPAKLNRQQNLDLCRMCHGGRMEKLKPSFSYVAGDPLSEYFITDNAGTVNTQGMDVHGNQYGMLAASKCFQNSSMTCGSCHNAHGDIAGSMEVYANKCNACHDNHGTSCKLSSSINKNSLNKECINCHMPEQASRSIMMLGEGENNLVSAHMRTHYITVYKDIANKIIQHIKSANQ